MLARDALVAAIQHLPTGPLEGVAFRLILARHAGTALSSIGSLRTGGRYNQRGRFEALYLASSPVTALQEVEALVETAAGLQGVKGPPRILLSVEYHLQWVVDLTDAAVQRAVGTTFDELCAPWRPLNAAGHRAPTQLLGEVVRDAGTIEGLSAPSARDPSTANLVVFPDRLRADSSLRVFDDSGLIDAHLP
jgi:RES domain-containing protein